MIEISKILNVIGFSFLGWVIMTVILVILDKKSYPAAVDEIRNLTGYTITLVILLVAMYLL
jgi:hypothetical protein